MVGVDMGAEEILAEGLGTGMRSHRLTPRPLSPKAAVTGDANPSSEHGGFRPRLCQKYFRILKVGEV